MLEAVFLVFVSAFFVIVVSFGRQLAEGVSFHGDSHAVESFHERVFCQEVFAQVVDEFPESVEASADNFHAVICRHGRENERQHVRVDKRLALFAVAVSVVEFLLFFELFQVQ